MVFASAFHFWRGNKWVPGLRFFLGPHNAGVRPPDLSINLIFPNGAGAEVTQWPADKVERRAVATLVPYARNARTHSQAQIDQIAASIRELGWTVPLGEGSDRSQRTRLGKALGRMRDRIFHVCALALRINSAGVRHQAQQRQLVHEGDAAPAGERGVPNGQPSPTRSPKETEVRQRDGEGGERWERSPAPFEDLEKDHA
jgi:hypothetical protein